MFISPNLYRKVNFYGIVKEQALIKDHIPILNTKFVNIDLIKEIIEEAKKEEVYAFSQAGITKDDISQLIDKDTELNK